MAKNNFFNKMLGFFNLTIDKTSKNPTDKSKALFPATVEKKKNGDVKVKNLIKGNPVLEQYYQTYLTETLDTADSFKNRENRYKDLDYAYYNSAYFSMAVELYADEATQSDAQDEILNVFAKEKKLEKYINEFFRKIGLNGNLLRSMAFDIALYADHFWALSTDEKEGITEVTPLNPYYVKDRIEFSALEVAKKQKAGNFTAMRKDMTMRKILDVIQQEKKGNDVASFFKRYLIGFALEEDMVLPPWNMLHFRRLTTNNEFAPFGRPILINAISPFRQLQAGKNLMALARASNFPIKIFGVDVSDKMTAMDKWEAIEEAKGEFKNLGVNSTTKEKFVIDNEVWMPKDLIDINIVDPNMNLDQIADIELLTNEMITSTGIPIGYIPTPEGSSFGDSGTALLQQSKVFGRRVYSNQTAMLDGLVSLVKMQLAMTGDFDVNSQFELSLNFPVVEESRDKMSIKSDSLRLAQDVLSGIGDAVGLDRDEALPMNVVKDVFSDISFLDSDDVNKWFKAIRVDTARNADDDGESNQEQLSEKLKNKLLTRLSEKQRKALVREAYFSYKKDNGLDEGVIGKRHYYSSVSNLECFNEKSLNIYKKVNDKKKLKG